MRIVFAGSPQIAVPTLQQLETAGHQVVGVLTRPDAPLGRKRVLTPTPVAAYAQNAGIPVHKTARITPKTVTWLTQLAPDLGVVVAYGALIPEHTLVLPKHGWINLHFSSLPKWRGAAPVQRALMAGELQLGMDVFRLVKELDAGDLLTRGVYQANPGDNAAKVLAAMALAGAPLVTAACDLLLKNPVAGIAQVGEPSYAAKLTREDGKLDLKQSATQVLAQWAGVTPEPGAFVTLNEQIVKIHQLAPVTEQPAPGESCGTAYLAGKRAYLVCGDGVLELVTVQPAGKAQMPAVAWLRGKNGTVNFDA